MRKKKMYPYWAVLPAIIIFTVFLVLPLLISLVCSFTDWNIRRLLTPSFRGLGNYGELFQDEIFLRSLFNTFLFAAATTLLKTLAGLGLAILIVRKIPCGKLLRTVYYAPCVLSVTVVGVLFKAILAKNGLLNNGIALLGAGADPIDWLAQYGTAIASVILIESWMWAGFNMFIFISGLQAISADYYESATLDGASAFEKFRHITLPLIVPSMTVVVTLSIAGGLKVFDIIYVITNGGPGFDTQVLATYTYQSFSLGFLGGI